MQTTRIPLAVKILYTAFMAVLVPGYWLNYGPTNFLYFCDLALIFALIGIWREDRLLIGIPAVGIMVPQVLWCMDFLTGLFGSSPLGMTAYMFNQESSLLLRGLSLFHGWLPFFLLWLVLRIGYDRRSFVGWWVVSWLAMFVAYFFMPVSKIEGQPLTPYNINYVYGLAEVSPQTDMPQNLWFGIMLVGVPFALALPAHLLMKRYLMRSSAS